MDCEDGADEFEDCGKLKYNRKLIAYIYQNICIPLQYHMAYSDKHHEAKYYIQNLEKHYCTCLYGSHKGIQILSFCSYGCIGFFHTIGYIRYTI